MVFYCSDFQLQELIDIRSHSVYIRSSTEPFDDDMSLDQERVKRWLVHFGLVKKTKIGITFMFLAMALVTKLRGIIEGSKSKMLVSIHTEHEEFHKKMAQ